MLYDMAWFLATVFGAKFPSLQEAHYDFAKALAEDELKSILCWCPSMYPHALSIKISIILEVATPTSDDGLVAGASSEHVAYVIEDEVFDIRRKYKVVAQDPQIAKSTPAAMLESLLARCKPPLRVGAFLAAGINSATSGCCSGDALGDKAEWNHGGQ